MNARNYRVKELARVSGVTVRTLHHYDSLRLLVPSARSDAGYRLYSEDDLYRLQQILLWRERGFALEQIRRIIDDPTFDRRGALLEQRLQLVERSRRTNAMIHSVDGALASLQGGNAMDAETLFDGFDPSRHEREVHQRWGDSDAYREAARRTKRYTKQDWVRIQAEGRNILDELAEKMRQSLTAVHDDVVELAEQHRLHIDRWFYPCSRAMHEGLAEMYLADQRFASKIDEHAEGLTNFLVDAIRANATRD